MTRPDLTVWYNTRCPVCNAGIGWEKSRLARAAKTGTIEFRDINREPDALARFGASLDDVRRRLHAVDAREIFTSAPTARSKSGGGRRDMSGSGGRSDCRSSAPWRGLRTTGSQIGCLRGTGGRGGGNWQLSRAGPLSDFRLATREIPSLGA